jgi:hypothetical protein
MELTRSHHQLKSLHSAEIVRLEQPLKAARDDPVSEKQGYATLY